MVLFVDNERQLASLSLSLSVLLEASRSSAWGHNFHGVDGSELGKIRSKIVLGKRFTKALDNKCSVVSLDFFIFDSSVDCNLFFLGESEERTDNTS